MSEKVWYLKIKLDIFAVYYEIVVLNCGKVQIWNS